MGSIVVGYGVLIVVLSFVLQQVSPPLSKVAFVSGLIAGGLSILWGIVGLSGHKRRTWAMLTMIALSFVLLTQGIDAWSAPAGETPGKLGGAILLTGMIVLTVGMMMYVMHGDRTPEFYRKEPERRHNSEPGSAPSDRGGKVR